MSRRKIEWLHYRFTNIINGLYSNVNTSSIYRASAFHVHNPIHKIICRSICSFDFIPFLNKVEKADFFTSQSVDSSSIVYYFLYNVLVIIIKATYKNYNFAGDKTNQVLF